MRAYVIVNMYMQGIHAGIQAAHALTEMGVQAVNENEQRLYSNWAKKDKTLIVLNGGNSQSLRKMIRKLSLACLTLELPWAEWHESEDALDGALTAFALLVPSRIYEIDVKSSSEPVWAYAGLPEGDIALTLNLLKLAR